MVATHLHGKDAESVCFWRPLCRPRTVNPVPETARLSARLVLWCEIRQETATLRKEELAKKQDATRGCLENITPKRDVPVPSFLRCGLICASCLHRHIGTRRTAGCAWRAMWCGWCDCGYEVRSAFHSSRPHMQCSCDRAILLPHHILGLLILPQPNEPAVPEMRAVCPLDELELTNEQRLQPLAVLHFRGC